MPRPRHDRDNCLVCHDDRIHRLLRRGLAPRLARDLRAAAPQLATLEAATDDQLEQIRALADDVLLELANPKG